jgi:hypothetical protein
MNLDPRIAVLALIAIGVLGARSPLVTFAAQLIVSVIMWWGGFWG